jgi:Uma2 family endonuclease
MATAPHRARARKVDYPTGDGKPMAETDIHRDDMMDMIRTLQDCFAADPMVYVSGNLLMFYEEGNRRKHVSPDVFVVRGVEKKRRDNYLVWEEGKAPDFVVELTSKSTRREDQVTKQRLYRDVLRVREYFQFDPTEDYLNPPLQGFRLVEGEYVAITPVDGRLPSEVLGLHLEQDGQELRLYDPERQARVMKLDERASAAEQRAESAEQRAESAEQRAQAGQALVREVSVEIERLRRENEALRRRMGSTE